jgi:dTDP-4-dehydrorhamnose reductase
MRGIDWEAKKASGMKNKLLVLGITGMLGQTLFRVLGKYDQFEVIGTARDMPRLKPSVAAEGRVITGVTVENFDTIVSAVADTQPDVLINCIGVIKQLSTASDPLKVIPINALFPHRLAELCRATRTRLIHFSTDCVFSGKRGSYTEKDVPDATDLYGQTKFLGEVSAPHALTIRTSIIGHELNSAVSLIDWFLSQPGPVKGYASAIYSGLPTAEMARILAEFVFPNPALNGVYHVSSRPISKLELLRFVAEQYGKTTEIIPDSTFVIDRSLDSTRFIKATGYQVPHWNELVKSMHRDYLSAV